MHYSAIIIGMGNLGRALANNSLFEKKPQLVYEWDFEKNRLLNINPQNLASGSHKKVWWKCKKCGYEWQSMVYTRTKKYPQGCPSCVKDKQSSFPEKIVFFYLKIHFLCST